MESETCLSPTELDALDSNDELTPLGRILARLPIEPRLGKTMILGCIFQLVSPHPSSSHHSIADCHIAVVVFLSPSSVGDAVCTISAASCFPEPFISEGKRLGFVHRNFAGSRFSDHVALLSAFQAWDDVRSEVTPLLCHCYVCVHELDSTRAGSSRLETQPGGSVDRWCVCLGLTGRRQKFLSVNTNVSTCLL